MEALPDSPADSLKSVPTASSITSYPHQQPYSTQAATPHGTPEAAATRPKQVKSRNGCSTCKAKRLKCDETKPVCNQCIKRKVPCGGYSKSFKWRSFEDTISHNFRTTQVERVRAQDTATETTPSPLASDSNSTAGSVEGPATPRVVVARSTAPLPSDAAIAIYTPDGSRFDMGKGSASTLQRPLLLDDFSNKGTIDPTTESSSFVSDKDADPDSDHEESTDITNSQEAELATQTMEEPHLTSETQALSFAFNQPRLAANSPEMLAFNFDRNTCGILSIKNGLNENPWRTLVWPMARESPALYHAIASLSAFHCSATDPKMKYPGMKHVSQSISYLCKNIKKMKIEDTLATSLALALADTWDVSTSTGIEHVRGGSALIGQAIVKMKSNKLSANSYRLKFLCKTWLYMDVLSRLTSLKTEDVDDDSPLWSQIDLLSNNDEIDPLLGCASTLFPIIGRVANLIARVRKTRYNTISLIAKANELKQELTNWTSPSYLEPAEDPTCDVQHAIQTAEAYQYATLLYLHQAVPEIPSETAEHLAQKVLLRIATVPTQSRTLIIQIYPMLAATCELIAPDDRAWALERWQQMQRRMQISNVDRCVEVMREVWRRRDEARSSGTGAHSSMIKETQHAVFLQPDNVDRNSPWNDSIEGIEQLPYERTARGGQHWAGVMIELGWEILLG